jgi:hypothetical protein
MRPVRPPSVDQVVLGRFGLVTAFTGSVSQQLSARPLDVLHAVTDVERLPTWNAAIERCIEVPATLEPGAEWVVRMHPRGWPPWPSRSAVVELDRQALRFVHRTWTDDGNPSRGTWLWQVTPAGTGSTLTVTWRMRPRTLGRRAVLARARRPMLQREVRRSLEALEPLLTRQRRAG